MALQPEGVGIVVMVADLHQHRREPGPGHLSQCGGRAGGDLVGQRVDLPQIFGDQLRSPLPASAAGIVKGDNAPGGGLGGAVSDGVGVQCQIEVIIAAVGLPDSGPRRGVRVIAAVADAVGPQIRLHSVHDPVHPVFLAAAAGDIRVPVLCGRA